MDENTNPTQEDQINQTPEVATEKISQDEAQIFLDQSTRFYSQYFIPDTCNIPYLELRNNAQKLQDWLDLTRNVIFDPNIDLKQEEIDQVVEEMEQVIEGANSSTTLFERVITPFIIGNLSYYIKKTAPELASKERFSSFIEVYEGMIMTYSNEDVVSNSIVALMPEYSNHAKFLMNAALLRLKGGELKFDRYRGFDNQRDARNFIRAYSLQEIFKRYTPALGLKSIDIAHGDREMQTESFGYPGIPNTSMVLPHEKLCDLMDEVLLYGMPLLAKDSQSTVLVRDLLPHFLFGVNYFNTNPGASTISKLKHVERTSSLLKPEYNAVDVFDAYLEGHTVNGKHVTSENLHEFLLCDDLTIWLTIRFARDLEDFISRTWDQLPVADKHLTRYRMAYKENGLLGLAEAQADAWLEIAFARFEAETASDIGEVTISTVPSLVDVAIGEYMASPNRSTQWRELEDTEALKLHLKYSMLSLALDIYRDDSGALSILTRTDREILKIAAKQVSTKTPITDIVTMVKGFAEFKTENDHIPLEILEQLNAERPSINRLVSKDVATMTEEDKATLRNYFADIIQVRQIGIRRNTSPTERRTKLKKPFKNKI